MIVKHVYIYPVKSLGGIEVAFAKMEIQGFQHDRRWMLVDDKGKFVTQRNDAKLALITTELNRDFLILKKAGQSDLYIPLQKEFKKAPKEVKVWSDLTAAYNEGKAARKWMKSAIGIDCRLYRQTEAANRISDIPGRDNVKTVSFADSQPILITNEKSLIELNERLDVPVPMNRFRANIVVDGSVAYEEDDWKYFSIGNTRFKVARPCGRCNVVNIDQLTGVGSDQPFKTLATYRFFRKNVNFGMRCKLAKHQNAGQLIKKGDTVLIEK